jgi:hypothetical protein
LEFEFPVLDFQAYFYLKMPQNNLKNMRKAGSIIDTARFAVTKIMNFTAESK